MESLYEINKRIAAVIISGAAALSCYTFPPLLKRILTATRM